MRQIFSRQPQLQGGGPRREFAFPHTDRIPTKACNPPSRPIPTGSERGRALTKKTYRASKSSEISQHTPHKSCRLLFQAHAAFAVYRKRSALHSPSLPAAPGRPAVRSRAGAPPAHAHLSPRRNFLLQPQLQGGNLCCVRPSSVPSPTRGRGERERESERERDR